MKRLALVLAVIVFLAGLGSAQAAFVHVDATGGIVYAADGNVFGVSVGDLVSLSADYDDSFYDGIGLGFVPFGLGTGNLFTIRVGTLTLLESYDVGYLPGTGRYSPTLGFLDGQLFDPKIDMSFGVNGSPVDFGSGVFEFSGSRSDNGSGVPEMFGRWDLPITIPEPGGLTLAALGIVSMGCMGWRRRGLV